MQRQVRQPDGERPRVALICDEFSLPRLAQRHQADRNPPGRGAGRHGRAAVLQPARRRRGVHGDHRRDRRGAIELARTGVTFEQAAIEWLRWGEARARLEALDARRPPLALDVPPAPEFGALPVNQITTRRIEAWKIRWLRRARRAPAGRQAAGDPARDLCSEKRGSRLIERSRMSATGAAVARWIRDPRGSAPGSLSCSTLLARGRQASAGRLPAGTRTRSTRQRLRCSRSQSPPCPSRRATRRRRVRGPR